jgi:hypothetical protein
VQGCSQQGATAAEFGLEVADPVAAVAVAVKVVEAEAGDSAAELGPGPGVAAADPGRQRTKMTGTVNAITTILPGSSRSRSLAPLTP